MAGLMMLVAGLMAGVMAGVMNDLCASCLISLYQLIYQATIPSATYFVHLGFLQEDEDYRLKQDTGTGCIVSILFHGRVLLAV